MKTFYFTTPSGVNVSGIGKNGSTAIGKAILEQFYPEKKPVMLGADSSNSPGWQAYAPKVETPDSAMIIIRDPVERFRSALAQMRLTYSVDMVLDEIESGGVLADNYHFKSASKYIVKNSLLYKFPEHIDTIASDLGLSDIPLVNDASNNPSKPDLTPDQLTRVQAIYADDIALYESITTAGQLLSFPATEEDKEVKRAEIKAARDNEYQSILTTSFGLQFKVDLETIIDIQTIVSLLADGDVYPSYKTANGEYHNISKEQFMLAIAEGVQRKGAAFTREYVLSQQIEAANTKTALEDIIW